MVAACTDCDFLRYRSVWHDPGSVSYYSDSPSLHFHCFGVLPGNSYFCISQEAKLKNAQDWFRANPVHYLFEPLQISLSKRELP
jgi:hypothetical protein